jgi:XTP/dITP diphosphohydrolase
MAMTTIAIATRNAHKVSEIQVMLGPGFHCLALKQLSGAPDTIEDADTFAGNATKKAVDLARWLTGSSFISHYPSLRYVLADDSGLEVDALNGAPGVHSARFASLDSGTPGNAPDADNNAKLLRLLKSIPMEMRTARFRCILALVELNGMTTRLFEGACDGRILFEIHGAGGFGYDPLFVPDGYSQTFAELGDEVKNRISHRFKALAKLKKALVS